MKSFLSKPPVLWFLLAFNLIVCVVAAFALAGPQQLATCIGMGAVSLGAGAALVGRRRQQVLSAN
jgi:hypothetical protein